MNSSKGQLRIIGGEWRSRRLEVPRDAVRPTPDRVRETLFNWLGQDLAGLACLDLFAGSGALGFEAASRGAARVVMVELDGAVFKVLQRSREAIRAARVELVHGDALAWLGAARERFDVVFLDPPFDGGLLPGVLAALPPRLADRARVYVEARTPLELARPWRELRRRRAGQVSYQLLEWDKAEQQ